MNSACAKFNFSRLEDDEFFSKVKCIIKCMENRPDFPAPAPTTREIQFALDEYKVALYKLNNPEQNTAANFHNKILRRKYLEMMLIKLPAFCENATVDPVSKTYLQQTDHQLMVA